MNVSITPDTQTVAPGEDGSIQVIGPSVESVDVTLEYKWYSDPEVTFSNKTARDPTITSEVEGEYAVQVTVKDQTGNEEKTLNATFIVKAPPGRYDEEEEVMATPSL